MVEVAAYCLGEGRRCAEMKTVFLRVLDAEDKAVALRRAISQPDTVRGHALL